VVFALVPLIVWRVYARFRKVIGRQRLSRYRAPVTLVLYSLLSALVADATLAHPGRVWWFAGSLLAGAALSLAGIRHTKFEATREGLFYTPNAPLGLALFALFVARIVYRVVEVYVLAPSLPRSTVEFMGSTTTVVAFGLLAGYFIGYAAGLARWRGSVLRTKRRREAAQSDA